MISLNSIRKGNVYSFKYTQPHKLSGEPAYLVEITDIYKDSVQCVNLENIEGIAYPDELHLTLDKWGGK